MLKNIKVAFTLSEVMLVLSIIGVIAALTIPGIIQSTNNKSNITMAKKVYSNLAQAVNLLQEDGFKCDDAECSNLANTLATKMNVIKTCSNNATGNCWATSTDIKAGPSNTASLSGLILSSGAFLSTDLKAGPTPATNIVAVDVNGAKGPNSGCKDIFYIGIDWNNYTLTNGNSAGIFKAGPTPIAPACSHEDWLTK